MLNGLTALELGRLRISVGYGRQKKGRPLSPVEVGILLRRILDSGIPLRDCADAINLNGTGHIGRFLRILELPNDLQHLVGWGSDKDCIGFSSAFEIVRLNNANDQRLVTEAILKHNLNSKEVRQLVQLKRRSQKTIPECIEDVLKMRPIIKKRYIYIGSLIDHKIEAKLVNLTQNDRDRILKSSISHIGLKGVSGRLGAKIFTLVGGEQFNQSMIDIGKENIEFQLRIHIGEAVQKNA